eukprot:1155332-Pelagomonas_calceolata.AAC.1
MHPHLHPYPSPPHTHVIIPSHSVSAVLNRLQILSMTIFAMHSHRAFPQPCIGTHDDGHQDILQPGGLPDRIVIMRQRGISDFCAVTFSPAGNFDLQITPKKSTH